MTLPLTPLTAGILAVSPAQAALADVIDPTNPAYSAKFDSVTDDTAALQAAFTAAAANNAALWFPQGRTAIVASGLTIAGPVVVYGNGCTIKKSAAMTSTAVTVSGDNTTIYDLVVDGNRSGGATGGGIVWSGASGVAINVESSHHTSHGWLVSGILDCYRCEAQDNKTGSPGTSTGASGFRASTGTLRLFGPCYAASNDGPGVRISSTAAIDCHIDARTTDNWAGVYIASNRGSSNYIWSDHELHYGAYLVAATRWDFGIVHVQYAGINDAAPLSGDPSGTSVFLQGASYCHFGTVISHGNAGYGVALSSTPDNTPATPSTHNWFGTVLCDATDSNNGSDPGIALHCGAQYNVFATVTVRGHSFAVRIGEGLYPRANNYNEFGTIYADTCTGCAVGIDAGSYNTVGHIVSRDGTTPYSARGVKGIVSFYMDDAPLTGNITTGTKTFVISSIDGPSIGTNYSVGAGVKIIGAAGGGGDLTTVIDSILGTTLTLRDAAGTTVTGAAITQVQIVTTGTINNGSQSLVVADADGFLVGRGILIAGAGAAAADLATTVTAVAGTTLTLKDAAGTSVVGAAVKSLGAVGNIIAWIDHATSPAQATKPVYIVYADTTSAKNTVIDGASHGDYQTGDVSLAGTANSVSPALASSGSLRTQ